MSQVFKEIPNIDIFNKLLKTIGIDGFKEEYSFRKKDFEKMETISKILVLKDELSKFYFPCKSKIYLENVDEQKVVTILRQFLKALNYNLISKERYSNGEKYILYTLTSTHKIHTPEQKIIYWI
jgi:hypothetical protein